MKCIVCLPSRFLFSFLNRRDSLRVSILCSLFYSLFLLTVYFSVSALALSENKTKLLVEKSPLLTETKEETTQAIRRLSQNVKEEFQFKRRENRSGLEKERENRLAPQEKPEERKARRVILRFHRWPSFKRQKEVQRILRASGLKKTKNIKSFKA